MVIAAIPAVADISLIPAVPLCAVAVKLRLTFTRKPTPLIGEFTLLTKSLQYTFDNNVIEAPFAVTFAHSTLLPFMLTVIGELAIISFVPPNIPPI